MVRVSTTLIVACVVETFGQSDGSFKHTHYGKAPCRTDEVLAGFEDKTSVCARECNAKKDCPTDVPLGAQTAQPNCVLQDQDTQKLYCALECGLFGGDCPTRSLCSDTIDGVCAWPGKAALPYYLPVFVTTGLQPNFAQWKHEYGIVTDDSRAEETFFANMQLYAAFNKNDTGVVLAANRFTHMTSDEFKGLAMFRSSGNLSSRRFASSSDLKEALEDGPISVSMQADERIFQGYQSGVISCGCGSTPNHDVLVVGYTDGYFIALNNWGTSWGHDGYVYLSDTGNVCGILDDAKCSSAAGAISV